MCVFPVIGSIMVVCTLAACYARSVPTYVEIKERFAVITPIVELSIR
jgi:hypothetical protein